MIYRENSSDAAVMQQRCSSDDAGLNESKTKRRNDGRSKRFEKS
jgi:hypothetical protein